VEQEPPQKLLGGDRHQPFLVLVGVVFPAERDLAVGQAYDPVVGDSDAMRVAGQLMQDVFGSAEGSFGVDYPILAEQRPQKAWKASPGSGIVAKQMRAYRLALRANIAETLLASLITEQGGKDIQHEEHEDILFGPGRRAQW
jgi:hypothetical protein